MNRQTLLTIASLCALILAVPTVASAQAYDDDMNGTRNRDPIPEPPRPDGTSTGIEEQAGVGGTIAYSEAGVLELGGSVGFTGGGDISQATVSPSIGWFFADNIQLSFIPSFTYVEANDDSSYFLSALIEPSYHLPLTNTVFVFGGVGGGYSYDEELGSGFAVAPRVGMNFILGRSGILTPSVNMTYSTTDSTSTPQGTLLAVSNTVGFNAGYTIMW